MKANVPKAKELVLLYGFDRDSQRSNTLYRILEELKLPVRSITEDMLSQTVGWCAQLPGFPAKENGEQEGGSNQPAETKDEAMVLCGLDKKRLDMLLFAMQRENLNVPLKAVMTAHNMTWEFRALLEELKKEREAIRFQIQAQRQ